MIILDKTKEEYIREVRARETILRIKGRPGGRKIDKAREVVDFNTGVYEDLDIVSLIDYNEELKKYE